MVAQLRKERRTYVVVSSFGLLRYGHIQVNFSGVSPWFEHQAPFAAHIYLHIYLHIHLSSGCALLLSISRPSGSIGVF